MTITNLLANMLVVGLHGGAFSSDIPTNTPAFQSFASDCMLTNSKMIATALAWDTNVVDRKDVTDSFAIPNTYGMRGSITFGKRYTFSYSKGALAGCSDQAYSELTIFGADQKQHEKMLKEWLSQSDLLNETSAKAVALSELSSLGINPNAMQFNKLTEKQETALVDGETRNLPFYTFTWQIPWSREETESYTSVQGSNHLAESTHQGKLVAHPKKTGYNSFKMIVSGLSKKVVLIENNTSYFKLSSPTNFLSLLNLPPDTVFVKAKPEDPGKTKEYELIEAKP